ncbi:2OG-Fe(II) oxygenase [Pseudomonas japonica]|uniref:2OG-Fe(II) oxygenase n=1 Tax=Pseudomonas japonica TaxID=256466 RepID=UPI00380C9644
MMPADLLERLDEDGFILLPGYLRDAHFGSWGLLRTLQATFYPALAEVANHWRARLDQPGRYPRQFSEFQAQCRAAGQAFDPSRFTRLGEQDYLALRHRGADTLAFPLQMAALFCAPGEDFSGGELLLSEQRPRMQSRPVVVPLRRGDIAVFPSHRRPVAGGNGYYPITTRHAVSRVRGGQRLGLDLYFHLVGTA